MATTRTRIRARWARGTAALGLAVGLVGLAGTAASAADTTPQVDRAARCARVRERLTEAPGVLGRIDAGVTKLEERLDEVSSSRRRILLEHRIERLERLRSQLEQKIAAARRRCDTV